MKNKIDMFFVKKLLYVRSDLIFRNPSVRKELKKHLNKINDDLKNGIIYGGAKKLRIKYNDVEYIYEESHLDEDKGKFILSTSKDEDCVSVFIFDKIAEIHGITNDKNCVQNTNESVGSTLLKITIKMLKKYAEKWGEALINKIILTDNSLKKCGKNDIILSKMLTLLRGDTWYGSYGFRPIKKIDKESYEENKNIMNTITITKANILRYIKLTNNNSLIKAIEKLIKQNPNMLLKDFLKNFLSKYDSLCHEFNKFYEELYKDIGLTDFHQKSFELDI